MHYELVKQLRVTADLATSDQWAALADALDEDSQEEESHGAAGHLRAEAEVARAMSELRAWREDD